MQRKDQAAEKRFFLEKKNQKTLVYEEFRLAQRAPNNKSFCLFCQKDALSADAIHNSKERLV